MRFAKILMMFAIALSLTAPASAEIIRIVPGPLDGCKILTPWGDYVAVQHGDTVWVGTEAQYEHARVGSILEQDGMREVKLEGISGPNNHAVVSMKAPSTSVGKVALYNISASILFGMGPDKKLHRPFKPANTEFVSVFWVQSEKASVTPRMYDLESKKTYKPFSNELHNGFHVSEFAMPKAALTHAMGMVFTLKKARPGYVPLASIAQHQYKNIQESVDDNLKHNVPISDSEVADLGPLHELDPSIPAELDASIPIHHEVDYEKLPNKGCPTAPNPKGKKISDSQMDEIYVGMTADQVVARFGKPTHCTDSNGSISYWWKRSGKKGGESIVTFDSKGLVETTGNIIED